jgi:hypothetical protein
MNLKKAALLLILCAAAFPAVASAKAGPTQQTSYSAKRRTLGTVFIHLITLGHKGN